MALKAVDGLIREVPDTVIPSAPPSRIITGEAFLALWTPAEVLANMADADLNYAALGALTQGTVNLDSPRLMALLANAVAAGKLTNARAAQIAAGTPPG